MKMEHGIILVEVVEMNYISVVIVLNKKLFATNTQNTIYVSGSVTAPSEAEEWLILVQRGYYNNPVPAYFSTSHRLF